MTEEYELLYEHCDALKELREAHMTEFERATIYTAEKISSNKPDLLSNNEQSFPPQENSLNIFDNDLIEDEKDNSYVTDQNPVITLREERRSFNGEDWLLEHMRKFVAQTPRLRFLKLFVLSGNMSIKRPYRLLAVRKDVFDDYAQGNPPSKDCPGDSHPNDLPHTQNFTHDDLDMPPNLNTLVVGAAFEGAPRNFILASRFHDDYERSADRLADRLREELAADNLIDNLHHDGT